jgi:hypothetical protein
MNVSDLLHRALRLEWLTPEEGVFLFENAATAELMYVGGSIMCRVMWSRGLLTAIPIQQMCALPIASSAIFTGGPATRSRISLPWRNTG